MKKFIIEIKEDDVVIYPVSIFQFNVLKVYNDGDLYVRECINTTDEYKRYIYKSMTGCKWDTRLYKDPFFRKAEEKDLQYLED